MKINLKNYSDVEITNISLIFSVVRAVDSNGATIYFIQTPREDHFITQERYLEEKNQHDQ